MVYFESYLFVLVVDDLTKYIQHHDALCVLFADNCLNDDIRAGINYYWKLIKSDATKDLVCPYG